MNSSSVRETNTIDFVTVPLGSVTEVKSIISGAKDKNPVLFINSLGNQMSQESKLSSTKNQAIEHKKVENEPKLSSSLPSVMPKLLSYNEFSSLTVTPPFVLKLCSMLSTKEFAEFISWGKNSDTVLVKDLLQFSSKVLPKYFKHKNFTSFLRQLNMYGFHTLRQGENWREFKNDLFKKNNSNHYDKIKRKTPQTNGVDPKSSSRTKASNFSAVKDSRKRKKDVLKQKSLKNANLVDKQNELIKQLLRRCEANEERIETLQEEMTSLKRSFKLFSSKRTHETGDSTGQKQQNSFPVKQRTTNNNGYDVGEGHDYSNSYAFSQIEGRQRTLSDSCLSTFSLSNLGLSTEAPFENGGIDLPAQDNTINAHRDGGRPWYWRKSSLDDMSLSFGGCNLARQKMPINHSSINREHSLQEQRSVKEEKIKRKKKAMRRDNG